jgi:hypothetical protein
MDGAISRTVLMIICLPALALVTGCSTMRTTDPPRTATEQFMLTTAIGRAVEQLSAAGLRDRAVFVDPTFLATSEQQFLLGEFRARLLTSGVRLASKREDARVIVEVRSGGVGIDRYDFLLGIPSVAFPALTATAGGPLVATPELALVKNLKQHGFASVAFVAYWADTGELLASSGPHVGRTNRADYWFLGVGPRTSGDIVTAEKQE